MIPNSFPVNSCGLDTGELDTLIFTRDSVVVRIGLVRMTFIMNGPVVDNVVLTRCCVKWGSLVPAHWRQAALR